VKVKRWTKKIRKRLRLLYKRNLQGFSKERFGEFLTRIGVRSGDVLMVHSSFNQFEGFHGTVVDVIDVLQRAVGPQGTLMMPTMPFGGLAVDHARTGSVFDMRRTPSRMGIITEAFRRSAGVWRSVHPTHPVAAWGLKADSMIAGHHRAASPCGADTPWSRLSDECGKILFLGTTVSTMTFFHTFDERLEDQMPLSPFLLEEFVLQSRDWNGEIVETKTRLFDPRASRVRNVSKLEPRRIRIVAILE